jgi:hypothetical protein
MKERERERVEKIMWLFTSRSRHGVVSNVWGHIGVRRLHQMLYHTRTVKKTKGKMIEGVGTQQKESKQEEGAPLSEF